MTDILRNAKQTDSELINLLTAQQFALRKLDTASEEELTSFYTEYENITKQVQNREAEISTAINNDANQYLSLAKQSLIGLRTNKESNFTDFVNATNTQEKNIALQKLKETQRQKKIIEKQLINACMVKYQNAEETAAIKRKRLLFLNLDATEKTALINELAQARSFKIQSLTDLLKDSQSELIETGKQKSIALQVQTAQANTELPLLTAKAKTLEKAILIIQKNIDSLTHAKEMQIINNKKALLRAVSATFNKDRVNVSNLINKYDNSITTSSTLVEAVTASSLLFAENENFRNEFSLRMLKNGAIKNIDGKLIAANYSNFAELLIGPVSEMLGGLFSKIGAGKDRALERDQMQAENTNMILQYLAASETANAQNYASSTASNSSTNTIIIASIIAFAVIAGVVIYKKTK